MTTLNQEWFNFQNSIKLNKPIENSISKTPKNKQKEMPKCSDIYISTQTKIAYLNKTIDLQTVFWNLPMIQYHQPTNGIIKKSIKISCHNPTQVEQMEKLINQEKTIQVRILQQRNIESVTKKFKDIRKIDIGLCKKDLTTYRKKQKGAFYNCFALILRILYKNEYKEVHVKIFNTGKLEIPGIQYDDLLTITLNNLINIIKPYTTEDINYSKNDIQTVLINSNFNCGFYIDRFKLFQTLKYTYNLHVGYDPCSYPGIQCKFCYHQDNIIHDGVYRKEANLEEDKWKRISFMIFRTGSVLIVGNCNVQILHIIYEFLKKILCNEYNQIALTTNNVKKKKSKKKVRKKTILFTTE